MSKKCTPLWREAHFEVKSVKTRGFRALLEVEMSKKCTQLWREAHFESFRSQKCKKLWGTERFLDVVQTCFCVAGARDCAPCQKWAEREGFVAFPKTMAGVGHLTRICKDGFRVADAVQETCSSELLGGPGADFLRGVALWSIRSSGLLRWFVWQVQHFVWLASLFRGRRNTLDRWNGKSQNASARGRQLCTQLSIFKETLAELLRFWCCQLRKIEEVSQKSFVFKLADRQIDR